MLISIIMPAYNAQSTIGNTIRSVLLQSYGHWELIVIDDSSHDDTRRVVAEIGDDRVRLVENEINVGPGLCRDVGLQLAKGDYIAFLDADDFWERTFLEVYLDACENNNADIAYGSYFMKSDKQTKIFQPKALSLKQLYVQSPLSCLATLIKTEMVSGCQFDGNTREDLHFWVQVLSKGTLNFIVVREPLATYCLSNQSRAANKVKVGMQTLVMIFKSRKLSFLQKIHVSIAYILNGIFKYKFKW